METCDDSNSKASRTEFNEEHANMAFMTTTLEENSTDTEFDLEHMSYVAESKHLNIRSLWSFLSSEETKIKKNNI